MARTLGTFAGPLGWETDAGLGDAQRYAYRDAALYPNKPLADWRAEIDERLAGGAPYGRISCWYEVDAAMRAWRAALESVSLDAPPVEVYACAPDDALAFLGY